MFDLHSHIIFGVDDGPKTIEESLALLEEAYRQGVRTVVATSHRRKGLFESPEELIWDNFQQVKALQESRLPDMTLLYGAEIYYTSDVLEKLETKRVPTLNGSRFALIEFSGNTPWKAIQQALQKLLLQGITPLVAHIERYEALAFEDKRVQELIRMGCYMQVNSLSVLKPKLFGDPTKLHKKRAQYFLDKNLVHIISSDMHNLEKRRPYMAEAYELIRKTYGHRRAEELFIHNAQTLLNNDYL